MVQQLENLTPKQTEALHLLAGGCSNVEIAIRMKMTTRGAEILVRRLKERFNFPDGVEKRVALAIWYRDHPTPYYMGPREVIDAESA